MPIGLRRKRPLTPIMNFESASVVAESDAFCISTVQLIGTSNVVCEAIQSSIGSLTHSSSSNAVTEAICAPVWSNQQMSSSNVFAEAVDINYLAGAGGGGAISVYDEGSLLSANVTCLDFKGVDIIAKTGSGSCIEIWSPAPSYASNYNSLNGITNGVVPNVATALRYVASPTVEGTPFYANGWDDLATHPTTRTSPLIYATPQAVSFKDLTTYFLVVVKDGNTPQSNVLSFNAGTITGDGVYSVANCSVTISGWAADSDKFRASVSVSINIAALFPAGGYFDVSISHVDGVDGTFTKTQ